MKKKVIELQFLASVYFLFHYEMKNQDIIGKTNIFMLTNLLYVPLKLYF